MCAKGSFRRYVKPIENGRLSMPHVNQCQFMAGNGTVWSAPTKQVDTQWAYGDEERIRTVNKVRGTWMGWGLEWGDCSFYKRLTECR